MIKKIESNPSSWQHEHIHDIKRIQQVCLRNGYQADVLDCAVIWKDLSNMSAAGWLMLPDDDNELWVRIENAVQSLAS